MPAQAQAPENPDLAVIQRSIDRWNAQDLEGFLDCLTDDVYWDDPPMPTPALDKVAVRSWAETALGAFPDMRFDVKRIYESTDHRYAIEWRASATFTGYFNPPGYAPTGRHLEFDGVDLIQVRDGKIARIQTMIDGMKLSMQAGLMPERPKPGSFAEKVGVRVQRAVAAFQRQRNRRR